jgi:hypothetical protein
MGCALCVKSTDWWFKVLRSSMAKGGEPGCRAHLRALGHDFFPLPLFRAIRLLRSSAQFGILEGNRKKISFIAPSHLSYAAAPRST